ncbi:folate-binding protein YgfZ [Marivibrio halodurans]|uniref:Folate-binding protein YgfZ n=1 Tax=Marivibrio halodurans TaxID=2039722 RepID=A0A8J7SLX7_9PROT|nr:folate-binding protein YgfZ [Marivibrio halodurans]MBP5857073.1 folate-binding protein YgfZ [Marivibrio halodurans]
MSERFYVERADRGLMTVAGADRVEFLQGLISNDVARASGERAIWSALLTPQGKYRHDFFLLDDPGAPDGASRFLILCEAGDRLMDLGMTLRRYVLRSTVKLDIARDLAVFLVAGKGAAAALGLPETGGAARAVPGGVAFVDPRDARAGAVVIAPAEAGRAFLEEAGFAPGNLADWDAIRLPLGLPDGSRDIEVDKAILLENGFDELGGIDWRKGCYMGQELTARTKYRGLVKKRLMPVRVMENGASMPATGSIVTLGGKEAGTLHSAVGEWGLALLRLKAVASAEESGKPLEADGVPLTPAPPDWLHLSRNGTADETA